MPSESCLNDAVPREHVQQRAETVFLKRPWRLGKIQLPSNVLCAPLAGCSDVPFRRMTSKYRPGIVYCEMVKMDALIRHHPGTLRYLDFEPSMHPVGAQLVGSKPELAGPCAKILEERGFNVIDFNCGCPVDKVTKDGSGSGMLQQPQKIGEIISNMVAAVKIPVTVKIRTGWDHNNIVAPLVTQIAEEAGASAICIHGRTRSQGYKGPANWDHIRACKQAAKKIQVIGNGDIMDATSAERIFAHTGCDAILLARGTMGQPWLIEDIYRHLSGEAPLARASTDLRDAFLEHLEHIVSYQVPQRAVLDLRRVGCWFLRSGTGVRALREALNRSQSVDEVRTLIHAYPWHETTFSRPAAPDESSSCTA